MHPESPAQATLTMAEVSLAPLVAAARGQALVRVLPELVPVVASMACCRRKR